MDLKVNIIKRIKEVGGVIDLSRILTISTANSRTSTTWIKQELTWQEFVNRLRVPITSTETLDEYMKLPTDKQANLKDVGGFIGGKLTDGTRKGGVEFRSIITLDLDNILAGKTEEVVKKVAAFDCAHVVHSTRKHERSKPRLRIHIPLDRDVSAEEYEAISRYLASAIGMEMCDHTTFQVGRLMYWPSCSSGSDYVFHPDESNTFINADGILAKYKDWRDISEWPTAPKEKKERNKELKKQENPLEKKGIVGAFCRSYDIYEAIEKYIPDAYEPHGNDSSRMTYTGGSTSAGAIIYEGDVFLYSNHATDPCSKTLCNAFDMVRRHMFGHLDSNAEENTPPVTMPSYVALKKLLLDDEKVKELLKEERENAIMEDFGIEGEDNSWLKGLTLNKKGDKVEPTIENVLLILENHPAIKGKLKYEEFSNSAQVLGTLPWNTSDGKREWKEIDDTQLRLFLEKEFKITGVLKIFDAVNACFDNNKYSAVQDYLKGLKWDGKKRIDTLLMDYLGAEDNIFTREATRKHLVAAVARGMGNYVKFDNMLVLQGLQGIGKSTFIGHLASNELYSDSLQSFTGKDAYEGLNGTWLVEIGELAALRKSETDAAKLFLSKVEDAYRPAYGRRLEKHPRRCVFYGTTNEKYFLKDATGNRRFWIIPVSINIPTKSVWDDLPNERDQI